ncbi:unnamed protein product [Thlaspi arvense]|uniref:Helicase ATP-binding domain-containing protein n=1 Tax=Thlaspi arvense TaxID=13288 RepID=A0AAU9R850_THLAR|nr:unnamed protein product [Thlaspi arvense]
MWRNEKQCRENEEERPISATAADESAAAIAAKASAAGLPESCALFLSIEAQSTYTAAASGSLAGNSSTISSSLFTNLPFRICEPSNLSQPAGFSSSASSFYRLRKASLTSDEKSKPECQSDAVNHAPEFPQVVIAPPKPVRRKPPNLITDSVPSPPVKAPMVFRSGGEGNFVKLNLNGKRGKKFPSKYKGPSKRSKFAYIWKRYKKSEGDGEEGESLLEEDSDLQKQREEEANGFISSVEDAVLSVKTEASDENLTKLLNLVYGYDSFRDGQLQAIKMVLAGSSTMLVLPTGSGKSLCYQIPAMILPGITLVVSPLVSLMIDQLKHLPSIIKGGLLSSSQRPEEATETPRKLKEGLIKVLFVSPERLLNVEFLSMFRMSYLRHLSLWMRHTAYQNDSRHQAFDGQNIVTLYVQSSPNTLAARNIIVAAILKKTHVKQGLHVFDIPAVASSIGVATTDVLTKIQTLKMKGEVTYEMKDPAFCYTILDSPRETCSLSSHLTKWLAEVETCKVRKLDIMSSAAVAAINFSNTSEVSSGAKQTQSLQSRILDYFNGDDKCDMPSKTTQNWGRYMSVDFRVIMEAAQTELLSFVDRNAALAT